MKASLSVSMSLLFNRQEGIKKANHFEKENKIAHKKTGFAVNASPALCG